MVVRNVITTLRHLLTPRMTHRVLSPAACPAHVGVVAAAAARVVFLLMTHCHQHMASTTNG